jgi:energy-coupling factor transport system permease protein
MAAILVVASLLSVGKKPTFNVFLTLLPMLVIMLLFLPMYHSDGTPMFSVFGFTLATREGLLQVALIDLRFISLAYVCTLLLATTKMYDFMLALQFFRIPFSVCLTISLVFRSIPAIADAFLQIQDSHKLRRAADAPRKKHRFRDFLPTLTSAMVVSLRSIPTLAMGLEARGFGRAAKRSSFHSLDSYRHAFGSSLLIVLIFAIVCLLFKS